MQALLEHSVQSYRPLPSDLRSRRVRTSSRPSPYPQSRVSKLTFSPDQTRPSNVDEVQKALATPVLQEVKVDTNAKSSTAPSLEAIKPFSPMFLDVEPKRENAYGLAPMARPRVPSNARRTALGWSKRSTGGKSSTDQKENVVGQGAVMTFVTFFLVSYFILQLLIIYLDLVKHYDLTDLDRVDVLLLARNNVHLDPSVSEVSNDPLRIWGSKLCYALLILCCNLIIILPAPSVMH